MFETNIRRLNANARGNPSVVKATSAHRRLFGTVLAFQTLTDMYVRFDDQYITVTSFRALLACQETSDGARRLKRSDSQTSSTLPG